MLSISFSAEQLSILNDAIISLPFKIAAPLIAHINEQIKAQQDAEVAKNCQ